MSKLIDNYQPDNRLFRDILLSIVSVIAGLYYACIKAYIYEALHWYDWLITIGLCVGTTACTFFRWRDRS